MARLLITAGPTRQYIDPVRFISNASSGKMGYAIARAALARGHDVTLISGPVHLRPPKGVRLIQTVTGQQMFDAVSRHLAVCDCLIMAAAVTDYAPARSSQRKIKKTSRPIRLRLVPVPDILAWASSNRPKGTIIVGFALEDRAIRTRAYYKLYKKGLDMIVANTPDAIGADQVSLLVRTKDGAWQDLPSATKSCQARRIIKLIEGLLARKDNG